MAAGILNLANWTKMRLPVWVRDKWQDWRSHYDPKSTIAEKVTVMLTAGFLFIGGLQLRVYNQQKEIMKQQKDIMQQQKEIMDAGGKQTQQLIDAANIQADAATKNANAAASFSDTASKQLKQMTQQGGDTHNLTEQAKNQAAATQELADRADKQLKLAAANLTVANFDHRFRDYPSARSQFVTVDYRLSLKNSGSTIAKNIHVNPGYGTSDDTNIDMSPDLGPGPPGPPPVGPGDYYYYDGTASAIDKNGHPMQPDTSSTTFYLKFTVMWDDVFDDHHIFVYCMRYRAWKDESIRWGTCPEQPKQSGK